MKYKFVLPSEKGCKLALEESFELPLAGSKSLQASMMWYKTSRGGTRCSSKGEIPAWALKSAQKYSQNCIFFHSSL